MKIRMATYGRNTNRVMLITGLVFTVLFNVFNFSSQYLSDSLHFLAFTCIFFTQYFVIFKICSAVKPLLLKILPQESDIYKRLSVVVVLSILLTGLILHATLQVFDAVPWFGYEYSEKAFLWSFIVIAILNIFITFLLEGVHSFNEWKKSTKETERLQAAYSQSRLNALKSQVNPHFLFNSLNSLSSLIQEDEDEAEKFLNEMSKVYRYMLRSDDEPMVTLETELTFIKSYQHLLLARYGEGLHLNLNIHAAALNRLIAPHSLQVIIENAFTQNIISKHSPLAISIQTDDQNNLVVQNNIQPKTVSDVLDFEAGLDNLVKKYELMGAPLTVEDTSHNNRNIIIPLLRKKEGTI